MLPAVKIRENWLRSLFIVVSVGGFELILGALRGDNHCSTKAASYAMPSSSGSTVAPGHSK